MADKPAAAAKAPDPISVQNEKVQKDAAARELQEQIDKESQEQEDKARGLGQTAAPVSTLKPVAVSLQPAPALVSRSGSAKPIMRIEEAYTSWVLTWKHCPTAQQAFDTPEELWRVHDKLKRFDTILMHEEFFAWEVLVRVTDINKDFQHVSTSLIGQVYTHTPRHLLLDVSKMVVRERGVIGKWSVIADPGTRQERVIKDGFESEAVAQHWLTTKKAA